MEIFSVLPARNLLSTFPIPLLQHLRATYRAHARFCLSSVLLWWLLLSRGLGGGRTRGGTRKRVYCVLNRRGRIDSNWRQREGTEGFSLDQLGVHARCGYFSALGSEGFSSSAPAWTVLCSAVLQKGSGVGSGWCLGEHQRTEGQADFVVVLTLIGAKGKDPRAFLWMS